MGKSAISMANMFKTPAKLPGQVIFNLPVSTLCRLRATGDPWREATTHIHPGHSASHDSHHLHVQVEKLPIKMWTF